ncbi:MAG: SDR family NAD(P)-dependent oxidoreductase [Bradyrhizobiaceae bacterium]|nr:MAG: SDR family NAD(P)-dependent oxidoreductase [Bradyrhizobiaceae bacterium]
MHNKPVALVTGANQGIGLQIAKELAAKNITVLAGSRNLGRGEEAVKTIEGEVHALQLDVTDAGSITAAAKHIREAYGRLDLLIQNAAISNMNRPPGQSVEDYAKATRPSNVSLEEMRAVWETNVFGVLMVYQAMLPLLREAPDARIVNISSGLGSLTASSDHSYAYRGIFGPVYPASKTALNALTVAMAIELENEGIKVNAVSPGYTSTSLNNYTGTDTVEQGAREAVRVALSQDGATGRFTRWENETIPW